MTMVLAVEKRTVVAAMKKHMNGWRKGAIGLAAAMLAIVLTTSAGTAHAAAEAAPKEVMINGVEFILIPEGWFYKTAGIPKEGPFQPLDDIGGGNVKIWLDSYYIAKFEARSRDLVKYLNSDAGKMEKYAGSTISCSIGLDKSGKHIRLRPDEDLPATHMHWELADRWARWMGFRLPNEIEWEKAARGPDQRIYPWGDAYPDETYAGFNTRSPCFTWPVDSFPKGRSPYGVYNMAGNVREFVADWYSVENDARLKDGMRNPSPASQGTVLTENFAGEYKGPWKILKGGRWQSKHRQLRIGYRNYAIPDDPFRCNGTRFALDVATVRAHLAKGTATVIAP
ncbi:formylglycine-generating enzyme family protein [Noviherbaspirillum sp. UKPF54]|nr:formylglycine-generating enzyme family protein [Noviherbaspirillum sp. UKPF54]